MVNYPVYPDARKPESIHDDVDRYGIGWPYIHNVYDVVNEIDRDTKEVKPKRNDKGERVFHFTYHYTK